MPETAVKFWGDRTAPLAPAPYPERRTLRDNWVDRIGARLVGGTAALLRPRRLQDHRFVRDVIARTERLERRPAAEIAERARRLRAAMLREGFIDPYLAEAFALTRRACRIHLGIAQRPVQIFAARRLIHGAMIEMATGEGKTVTAALAASAAAMAGVPVHVITVNGYLAQRDCAMLRPVYEAMGLTCGAVVQGMEDAERRAAYAADIVHAECKELCFDYLRDRLSVGPRRGAGRVVIGRYSGASAKAPLMLRGLHYAIIDEADSVLIDEAKTPLIISAEAPLPPEEALRLREALEIATELEEGRDYTIFPDQREIRLTSAGKQAARRASHDLGGLWGVERAREEAVTQALSARHLFLCDRHYMLRDGKVQIVDEFTGRAMPDRSWEAGLHQLVEIKEGLAPTGTKVPVARITFQRFFSRYRRLSGMTGTGMECAGEVWAAFALRTTPVPTHAPLRRRAQPSRLFATQQQRWQAVVARIGAIAGTARRPVLIGTRSVAASETVSAMLGAAGIAHVVLNAQQDADEAAIVAAAGRPGAVTVATNMAGRGTDITLDDGVRAAGGLHVILTEFHESPRIDRQLIGRCARQGDPGSWEAMVAIDDEVFTRFAPVFARMLRPLAVGPGAGLVLALLRRMAQFRAERQGRLTRMAQMLSEQDQEKRLAFTGAPL